MKYTKEYFIEKFKAIPDYEIGRGIHNHCALWHCGVRDNDLDYISTPEAKALINLFGGKTETENEIEYIAVYAVNDGFGIDSTKSTPKERILNKLQSL